MEDSFKTMSYRDLQKLAKTAGVKANLPKADLIRALEGNASSLDEESADEDRVENVAATGETVLNSTFEIAKGLAAPVDRTFEKEAESGPHLGGKRRSSRLSTDRTTPRFVSESTVVPGFVTVAPSVTASTAQTLTASRKSTPRAVGE